MRNESEDDPSLEVSSRHDSISMSNVSDDDDDDGDQEDGTETEAEGYRIDVGDDRV